MPDTWRTISHECREAARELREKRLWRSVLNRAYYSIFAEVTRALLLAGVTMPRDWEGPTHQRVVDGSLIARHLNKWLTPSETARLIWLISHLYSLRRIGDYQPSVEVGKEEADMAFGKLIYALPLLEKVR